jgi:FO synthase
LAAGIDDWGGISPLTPDHVNPERPWPSLDQLRDLTAQAGMELRERLTVHPEYVVGSLRHGEAWLDPRVAHHIAALAGTDGLALDGVRPKGLQWQTPDQGLESAGRTDLHASIDTDGRTHDRREDLDSVYGDWHELGRASNAHVTAAPVLLHGEERAAELTPPCCRTPGARAHHGERGPSQACLPVGGRPAPRDGGR